MKIISIINHKGGVGKTTSAANIGAALKILGKKVLLIDIDPQANLTLHLGWDIDESNIYGAMNGKYPLPIKQKEGFPDIVTSHLDLSAADIEFNNEAGREFLLRELLVPIKKDYDYIIIDCPPSLGVLTLNALSTSDTIIMAVEPGRFAIVGMGKLFDVVKKVKSRVNQDLEKVFILITKTDSRKIIHKDIIQTLHSTYEANTFNHVIRNNVAVEEAQMQGVDIFTYDSKSNAAEDYMNITKELIKYK